MLPPGGLGGVSDVGLVILCSFLKCPRGLTEGCGENEDLPICVKGTLLQLSSRHALHLKGHVVATLLLSTTRFVERTQFYLLSDNRRDSVCDELDTLSDETILLPSVPANKHISVRVQLTLTRNPTLWRCLEYRVLHYLWPKIKLYD